LDRWKDAEGKVCEMRSLLLERPKPSATESAEIAKLHSLVEKGNNQITSLDNAVSWLQAERQKTIDAQAVDATHADELAAIKA
jgi:hypothetical protein